MNEPKMKKIMDLMKIRIHFYKDMCNHTYFFTEPSYEGSLPEKLIKKLKQPDEVKCTILKDIKDLFNKLDDSRFLVDTLNKECSMYLYENRDKNYKNEDVFSLLRFAITGNPVGAPVGDILEIIGK